MSTKYLDKIGLSYFWTKLKEWIASASSNLVHRTGDESVSGLKEFGNSYYDSTNPGSTDWESSSLIVRFQNYVKGSGAPAANKYANLLFLDKEGDNVDWGGRLGSVETDVLANGQHRTRLVAYKNEIVDGVDVRDNTGLIVGYDADGNKFASAPSTSSDRTAGSDIVTRDWIPVDGRIVHTAGTDSLSGVKNVNVGVAAGTGICLQDSMNFISSDANFLQGVVPADGKNHFATVNFFDYAANGVDITTSNYKNYITGVIQQALRTDGSFDSRIFSAGRIDGTYITSVLGVGCDADGVKYANAPSTSLDRNAATDILTRDWIPKDTRIVHTTGDEVISGTKTFSSAITGSVSGNAATATKLATARNINGVSFDGSADITVVDSTKLSLAGGTMTGNITMSASKSIIFDLSATVPTANTPRNIPIQFKSRSIDNDYVFTNYPFFEIPLTQTANYGMGVGFGANGLTVIGAGEAGKNIVAAESLTGNSEQVVIAADSTIDFYTNCDRIASRVKTTIDTNGNFSGKSSNVTGTVAIANGGTGATTRLNAVKALTNENVGSNANYFLTITTNWAKAGYTSVADVKTVLGLKSAAYTESSDYALDTSVVHNTGSENISGYKRFELSTCIRSSVTKGTAPSVDSYRQLAFSEKDGDATGPHRFGCIESTVSPGNSVEMSMRAYKAEAGSTANASISIVYPASGDAFTSAPHPASAADDSTKIATTGWVRDATGNFACNAATAAKLATARTINGVSFDGSSNITVADSTKLPLTGGTMTGNVTWKRVNHTRGTAPSSTSYFSCADFKDSANNRFGLIENAYYQNKSSVTAIYAYNTTIASGGSIGSLGIGCDTSGNVYTVAPTPAAADSSTKIATTAYVKAQGYADSEDVSSTFTWESGEAPAYFFAYRVGKIVHISYQGVSKAHSGGDRLGTTTLAVVDYTYMPFVKNASVYGTISISKFAGSASNVAIGTISSTTVSGRIYFNGSFLLS